MPVLDWTGTDLAWTLPDGAKALRFDANAFAAFELHILQRPGAQEDDSAAEQEAAAHCFATMSYDDKALLTRNIITSLPGAEEGYTLELEKRATRWISFAPSWRSMTGSTRRRCASI
nr:Mannonate dehydratase [Candidatus Pantoea persica]